MHVRRITISLMLAAGLILALGAPVVADAPHKAPAGYRTAKVKKAGFSIAIPNAWEVINLTRADANELFDELERSAPELSAQLPADIGDLIAQNAVLFAIDTEAPSDFALNLNVLHLADVTDDPTIDDIRAQFEGIAEEADYSETEISGRPAIKTVYTLDLGVTVVQGVQYIVVGKKGGLVFTFTSGPDESPEEFDVMAESIKL